MPLFALMQLAPWSEFLNRLSRLGAGAQRGALYLFAAAALLLAGWAIGSVLATVVRSILRAVHFNEAIYRVTQTRGTGQHEPAGLVGWAINWLMVALAALFALELLGINLHATVGLRLREVVPRIVTSAIIFGVGSLVAMLLGSLTRRFLATAGVSGARPRGQVMSVAVTGFAALLALEQLGVAAQFVMILGIVVVGVAALGLALAFALGCKDLVRDFVVEYVRSLEEDKPRRSA